MICLGDDHLPDLECLLSDIKSDWYIIGEALSVPDAIVCVVDDNHSQINLAFVDVLIQWIKGKLLHVLNKTVIDIIMICLGNNYSQIEPAFRDVFIQWINEDNEGNKSVLIEALKVMKENYLSHEN